MRKIERRPSKFNHALGYTMLGVGAAALIGTIAALVAKSKKEDRRFRECLIEALNEEFEAAHPEEDVALHVIVVGPNNDESCSGDCDCTCCSCHECDCDSGHCNCECEHDPDCVCDDCKVAHSPDCTCGECKPEHDADCGCDKCKAEQILTEELTPEVKLEKPARKSKKQPE